MEDTGSKTSGISKLDLDNSHTWLSPSQALARHSGTLQVDDELALVVLNGLPAEYKTLLTVLTAAESRLKLDELVPKLLVVENEDDKPVPESKAYVARPGNGQASRRQGGSSGQKRKEIRKCHHCGKTGHLKKN